MDINMDLITAEVKKAFDTFVENIVVYIVGFIIALIGVFVFIFAGPAIYGMSYMILKGSRGEKVEIKDVFYGMSSVEMFIRSWIGLIGVAIVPVALCIGCVVIILILTLISPTMGLMLGMLLYLVLLVAMFVIGIFLYYALYIYVMTPSENIMYAIKESISISKSNTIMVILTMIIASILSILYVTAPLGSLFAVNMLKQLKPDIKDNSGI